MSSTNSLVLRTCDAIFSKNFVSFAALSGCGWLLDASVLMVLHGLTRIPVFAANLTSSLLAATFVFIVSRKRIHTGSENDLVGRVGLYLVYTFVVIVFVSAIMPLLTLLIERQMTSRGTGNVSLLLAKIIVTPPQLLSNFLVSRMIARKRLRSAS